MEGYFRLRVCVYSFIRELFFGKFGHVTKTLEGKNIELNGN